MPDDDTPPTWVGLVDLGPAEGHHEAWTSTFGRQGGAIAWVAARAEDAGVFRRLVADDAEDRRWHVRGIDDVERHRFTAASTELDDLTDELDDPDVSVAWGTMQTYPDEELSDVAFLAEIADDGELSDLQSRVVATLADMLAGLELPRLDGTSFHFEDDRAVVELSQVDSGGHDLVVAIGEDTVDVDYGWAHETFDVDGDDGLDGAYQFIYSALQGGVKVEVFCSWGRVRKVHTYVLMGGQTWEHAFTMGMFVPPGFRDPPPTTHVVGFT